MNSSGELWTKVAPHSHVFAPFAKFADLTGLAEFAGSADLPGLVGLTEFAGSADEEIISVLLPERFGPLRLHCIALLCFALLCIA